MVVNLELNDELFFETYIVPLVDEYDISRSGTEYPGYFKQLLPNRNISYIKVQDVPNIKQCILEIPYIIVSIVSISFLAYVNNSLLDKFEKLLQKIHQDKMFYMEHIAELEKENEDMKQIFKRIREVAELE